MPRIMDFGQVDETKFVDPSGVHVAYFATENTGNFHPGAAHIVQSRDGYEPAKPEHAYMFPHATLKDGKIRTSDGRVAMIGLKSEYEEFHRKRREQQKSAPGHKDRHGETLTQETMEEIAAFGVPIRTNLSNTDPPVIEGGNAVSIEDNEPNEGEN